MQKHVIDSRKNILNFGVKEYKQYKDLFFVLSYRDLRIRYAQTFLGFLWAILQPTATLLIFVLIFGKAIKIDTEGIPYPLFAICGISMWSYFSFVLNQSGQSIIGAQEMIKKVYFPRLVIPLSKAIVGFVDFGVALIILTILLVFYNYTPSPYLWVAPLFIFLNIITALGVGVWLSALSVRYRDFQHVVPFLVQFGLYATPVAYPAKLIPKNYLWLYNMNPMTGIIEGFRWTILGSQPPNGYIWLSIAAIMIIFLSSLIYFKYVEDTMVDIV